MARGTTFIQVVTSFCRSLLVDEKVPRRKKGANEDLEEEEKKEEEENREVKGAGGGSKEPDVWTAGKRLRARGDQGRS
jgi:hypothetical protein